MRQIFYNLFESRILVRKFWPDRDLRNSSFEENLPSWRSDFWNSPRVDIWNCSPCTKRRPLPVKMIIRGLMLCIYPVTILCNTCTRCYSIKYSCWLLPPKVWVDPRHQNLRAEKNPTPLGFEPGSPVQRQCYPLDNGILASGESKLRTWYRERKSQTPYYDAERWLHSLTYHLAGWVVQW